MGLVPSFSDAVSSSEYNRMKTIGVNLVRADFFWTAPIQTDWSGSDARMAAARTAGMNMLAILNGLPSGATDAQYGDFCRAVVTRYPDLTMVEVQNEPSLNNISDTRFVGLLRACSNAVKAVRPSITVVAPTENPRFFSTILTAGPWPNVDKWSVHPYTDPHQNGPDEGTNEWSYYEVKLEYDLASAANQPKPMWITEMGWSTAVGCTDSYWCRDHIDISEATQATYMGRAIDRCFNEWPTFCEKFIVYSYKDLSNTPSNFYDHFGALRYDGSAKPLWAVLDSKV